MTRSYKPANIERLSGNPPKRTETNQAKKVKRCPIMGQPVEWLDNYNEKIRREEAYKIKLNTNHERLRRLLQQKDRAAI